MSRTSFIFGAVLSVALHGAILLPQASSILVIPRPEQVAGERGQIVLAQTEKPWPDEPPPAALKVKEVVKTRAEVMAESTIGETDGENDGALPAMRILWSGPQELCSVARSLGMRVVAMDGEHQVVGEVLLDGTSRLVRFDGDLAGYSNRVRSLPTDFFEPLLRAGNDPSVASFWVLVPAEVDARFVRVQLDAIRERGLSAADVVSVEARFVEEPAGDYTLVVTAVNTSEKIGANHG